MTIPFDLESVKVGDKVAYKEYHYLGNYLGLRVMTVDRLTATQIVCGSMRFRKTDGRRDCTGQDITLFVPSVKEIEDSNAFKRQLCEERVLREWFDFLKKPNVEQLKAMKAAYDTLCNKET